MTIEVETELDIAALSAQWKEVCAIDKPRTISRIEDLPALEQFSSADIKWVVDGVFAEGALHMVTSEPGGGKSTFTTSLGYAVSHSREFIGRATSNRPVLVLDAENPLPAVRERFHRLGITTDSDFRIWGQWIGEDPPAPSEPVVLDWVLRSNPKPLIIVDSVIAFHPGAENDSTETRRYMAQYLRLTAMGATVIVLHHVGKSENSKDFRGSSDYKAVIDIGYKLTNLGDPSRLSELELRSFKQRFSVPPVLRIRYDDGKFIVDRTEGSKTVTEQLRDLLKENPGITKKSFEALAAQRGLGRNRGRDFLETGVTNETVRVQTAANNSKLHSWAEGAVIERENE